MVITGVIWILLVEAVVVSQLPRLRKWADRWRRRKHPVDECAYCAKLLTRKQAHVLVERFEGEMERSVGGAGAGTGCSVTYCSAHCPGGCLQGCRLRTV